MNLSEQITNFKIPKMFFRLVVVFISFPLSSYCQLSNDTLKIRIKNEAERMVNALQSKEYELFVKYMHPALIKSAGSENEIIKLLKDGLYNGTTIESIDLSTPSDTIVVFDEVQCTLKENLHLLVNGHKVITSSSIIGVSFDRGNRWYFIDANDKNWPQLKENIPSLSNRLEIAKFRIIQVHDE